MTVNISDLFDGFHQIAELAASRFGLGADTEPSFDEFLEQFELDVFLPACARRAGMIARRDVEPDDVIAMIRIRERDGSIRPGAAGRYHSHGFDYETASGAVENQIVAANMLLRPRSEVELVIVFDRNDATTANGEDHGS